VSRRRASSRVCGKMRGRTRMGCSREEVVGLVSSNGEDREQTEGRRMGAKNGG